MLARFRGERERERARERARARETERERERERERVDSFIVHHLSGVCEENDAGKLLLLSLVGATVFVKDGFTTLQRILVGCRQVVDARLPQAASTGKRNMDIAVKIDWQ